MKKCVWPWVPRSNVWDTWIVSTFSTSHASKLLESIQRSCLYDVYNQRYERSYTNVFDLDFKVNHQGQRLIWVFWDPRLWNVRIDTKIKSAACIQPELRKVIQWMCVTVSSKVNRQGHVIFSTFLISSTSKMLESTPRSTSYHVYNRR